MGSDRVGTALRDGARAQVDPSSSTATRRIQAAGLLVICGILLAAVTVAGAVGILIKLRDDQLSDSSRELGNVVSILADQTDRAFRAVELLEASLVERINGLGVASPEEYERRMSGYEVHLALKDKVSGRPQVVSIGLIDVNGKLFNSSRRWPPPDFDVADREFYHALKSDPGLTSFLGGPARDRATGSWIIHLARKVAGPNDEFLGLVVGAMDAGYFERYFATLPLGAGSQIVLYRNDGTLLAQYPPDERSPANSTLPKNVVELSAGDAARPSILIDGQERLVAARKFAHDQLTIAATKTVAAALAEWRTAAIFVSSMAVLLILVIGAVVLLGVRQIRNYEVLADARAQSDQKMLLDTAINNMPSGLIMFDASERIVICNRRYIEMFGLSPEIVKPGCTLRALISHRKESGSFSGDPERYYRELRERLAGNLPSSHSVQAPDGRSFWITNRPMANGGWVVTHEDVTERRNAEVKLERTQAFLNTVIENVPVTVLVKEVKSQRYILANRAAEALWGFSRDNVLGKTAHQIFPKKTADSIAAREMELLRSGGPRQSHGAHQIETPANGSHLVDFKRVAIPGGDGEPEYLLVVMENITERVRANERISYMAHHDLLTGLANRVLFLDKLEHAGTHLRSRGAPFAIFMLDLDRFKDVNDSRGHPVGDVLLREVAQRLKSVLCDSDVLARLGGDEFAILRPGGARDAEDAGRIAATIIDVLAEPFDIEGSKIVIGASIGIVQAPADGIEPSELMKKADLALYRKKSSGRNGYCFFDAKMTAEADVRHQLEQDLRNAVVNNELIVHYQPIVDVSTRKPCGVEALVRWRHPQRGNIPPLQFIPLAEESGLIIPLGEWILQRACADAASWPSDVKVAVNLSPTQFRSADLMDVILCALVESGLPPERLELEITESVLIESPVDVLSVIRQLKNIGVSIALDDFGTGYSSLSYLTMFPFDKIKIDKSFTQNMTKRTDCAAVVSSVLTLGRGLGITTTAEGVETEEQFALLRAAGVHTVQGYLFGRPCPVSELDFGAATGQSAASAA